MQEYDRKRPKTKRSFRPISFKLKYRPRQNSGIHKIGTFHELQTLFSELPSLICFISIDLKPNALHWLQLFRILQYFICSKVSTVSTVNTTKKMYVQWSSWSSTTTILQNSRNNSPYLTVLWWVMNSDTELRERLTEGSSSDSISLPPQTK